MHKLCTFTTLLLAIAATSALTSAFALERPTLPSSAKKLDAAGIMALYHGSRASFDNYSNDVSLTGQIFYDLKTKVMFGHYNFGNKDRGVFKGKIKIKGDMFCNKSSGDKETCATVYRDGQTYYEVDNKGQVLSANMILANPPAVPANGKALSPPEVLALSNGKRLMVTVYDDKVRVVAESNWSVKKKTVSGKYISGGKDEGKFTLKFVENKNSLCFPQGKQENCYHYFAAENGYYELNSEGNLHAWSVIP